MNPSLDLVVEERLSGQREAEALRVVQELLQLQVGDRVFVVLKGEEVASGLARCHRHAGPHIAVSIQIELYKTAVAFVSIC